MSEQQQNKQLANYPNGLPAPQETIATLKGYISDDKTILSHLQYALQDARNYDFSAPTGMGKTSAILDLSLRHGYKIILAVPYRSQVKQLKKEHKQHDSRICYLHSNLKPNASNIYITTYDSINKLTIDALKSEGYKLIIDECHHLAHSHNYRAKAINYLTEIAKKIPTIYISATNKLIKKPDDRIQIELKRHYQSLVPVNYIHNTEQYTNAISELVNTELSTQDTKSVLLIQLNSESKIKELSIYLQEKYINSIEVSTIYKKTANEFREQNKELKQHPKLRDNYNKTEIQIQDQTDNAINGITNNQLIPTSNKLQVVLTTCLINDGININNDNVHIVNCDIKSTDELIQFFGRVRKKESAKYTIITKQLSKLEINRDIGFIQENTTRIIEQVKELSLQSKEQLSKEDFDGKKSLSNLLVYTQDDADIQLKLLAHKKLLIASKANNSAFIELVNGDINKHGYSLQAVPFSPTQEKCTKLTQHSYTKEHYFYALFASGIYSATGDRLAYYEKLELNPSYSEYLKEPVQMILNASVSDKKRLLEIIEAINEAKPLNPLSELLKEISNIRKIKLIKYIYKAIRDKKEAIIKSKTVLDELQLKDIRHFIDVYLVHNEINQDTYTLTSLSKRYSHLDRAEIKQMLEVLTTFELNNTKQSRNTIKNVFLFDGTTPRKAPLYNGNIDKHIEPKKPPIVDINSLPVQTAIVNACNELELIPPNFPIYEQKTKLYTEKRQQKGLLTVDGNDSTPNINISRFMNGDKKRRSINTYDFAGSNYQYKQPTITSNNNSEILAKKPDMQVLDSAYFDSNKKAYDDMQALDLSNDYLQRKGIDDILRQHPKIASMLKSSNNHISKPNNNTIEKMLKENPNAVIVPMFDNQRNMKMLSFQAISLHKKRFTGDLSYKGGYFMLPAANQTQKTVLSEGLATGLSLYEALNCKYNIAICFSCFNIIEVAVKLKKFCTFYDGIDIDIAGDKTRDALTINNIPLLELPNNLNSELIELNSELIELNRKLIEQNIELISRNEKPKKLNKLLDYNDLLTYNAGFGAASGFL